MRLTVFNEYITDVPEYERHWTAWLCDFLFDVIPRVPISVDSSCAVPVDVDTFSCYDEACMMILEGNGVGVVAPVIEII